MGGTGERSPKAAPPPGVDEAGKIQQLGFAIQFPESTRPSQTHSSIKRYLPRFAWRMYCKWSVRCSARNGRNSSQESARDQMIRGEGEFVRDDRLTKIALAAGSIFSCSNRPATPLCILPRRDSVTAPDDQLATRRGHRRPHLARISLCRRRRAPHAKIGVWNLRALSQFLLRRSGASGVHPVEMDRADFPGAVATKPPRHVNTTNRNSLHFDK